MTRGFTFRSSLLYSDYKDQYDGLSFKIKGVLRISWANVLMYNKPIYMMLYLDKSCIDAMTVKYESPTKHKYQDWWAITSPYPEDNNNHKLAEALLGKEGFKLFVSSRFGCRRIGVEGTISNFDHSSYSKGVYEYSAETKIIDFDFPFINESGFPTVDLNDFKIIDVNSISIAEYKTGPKPFISNTQESQCYPLPGMFVQAMASDYYVNLRDKPSAKEGKVIARLVAQTCEAFVRVDELGSTDELIDEVWNTFDTGRSEFLKTNKMDVIASNAYTIFVSDVLPGDWCRVTIYSYKRDENPEYPVMADDLNDDKMCQTIGEKPSTVRLLQGYIHGSQLSGLSACTDYYYKGGW